MSKSTIHHLILETIASLEVADEDNPHLTDMLDKMSQINLSLENIEEIEGTVPTDDVLFENAISHMSERQFGKLKSVLTDAKVHLHWQVDDGGYYAHGDDVGEGYKNGNMHCLLIGPQYSAIKSDDFLLGFFLLSPHTLYRDHKHLAPEIYMPLTGPSGWRFDIGEWENRSAGSIIYNAPNEVHATRVYEAPFLALFAWTQDINTICIVEPADDWESIEAQLQMAQT